jgi:hypothetical protein
VVQGGWEGLTRDVAAGKLEVAVAEVAAAEQEPALVVERIGTHGGSFLPGWRRTAIVEAASVQVAWRFACPVDRFVRAPCPARRPPL